MLNKFNTIKSILMDIKGFEEALKELKPKINLANNPFYYPFIWNEVEKTIWQIQVTQEYFRDIRGREPKTFLDIGCGIGNVIHIAQILGLKCYGVELIPEYIEVANKIVPEAHIEQGDILEWQPKFEADIIYLYQPIANFERMEQFLDHFLSYVPKGQVVIANLATEFDKFKKQVEFYDNFCIAVVK